MADIDSSLGYTSDDLVVDVTVEDRVRRRFDELLVTAGAAETCAPLGLTLLSGLTDGSGPVTDLDALMFAAFPDPDDPVHPRWGKNRHADPILGFGAFTMGTKPMDVTDDPVPADGPAAPGPATAGDGVRVHVVDVALDPGDPVPHLRPARAGHSRFVTSLIAERAPAAAVTVVPVVDARTGRATLWDTAVGMAAAIEARAHVVNLSLGCFTADGKPPLLLARAVEKVSAVALVVAAAGNHAAVAGYRRGRTAESSCFPAAQEGVISVGAIEPDGRRAPFSVVGDCSAVGVDVLGEFLSGEVMMPSGTRTFGGFATWSGTSFAAATVTGALASRLAASPTTSKADALALLHGQDGITVGHVVF